MPLKRQDENGKPVPWEWIDTKCFANRYPPQSDLPDCEGIMVLKDVEIKPGSFDAGSEEGRPYYIHKDPYLEKIWVCNVCGFIFPE